MRLIAVVAFAATLAAAPLSAADKFPATGGDIDITPINHASVQVEHARTRDQFPEGIPLANGETKIVAGFTIEAVAAYDLKPGEPFHPNEN